MQEEAQTDHRETEWQLEAPRSGNVESWLRDRDEDKDGLSVSEGREREIHDRYYDTADWRMWRAGYALRIRELAEQANMSESSLFHSFKQVTRMSPLQFQKKLRLHEARRLMLSEGLEAATASFRVGYESPSHFSREYSRLFGAPPRADVIKLRGETPQAVRL